VFPVYPLLKHTIRLLLLCCFSLSCQLCWRSEPTFNPVVFRLLFLHPFPPCSRAAPGRQLFFWAFTPRTFLIFTVNRWFHPRWFCPPPSLKLPEVFLLTSSAFVGCVSSLFFMTFSDYVVPSICSTARVLVKAGPPPPFFFSQKTVLPLPGFFFLSPLRPLNDLPIPVKVSGLRLSSRKQVIDFFSRR